MGHFHMPWFLTSTDFFGFQYIGPLKIRHGFYIFCLKISTQLSKLNFDPRFGGKCHDVKNYICPIKFGISEYSKRKRGNDRGQLV